VISADVDLTKVWRFCLDYRLLNSMTEPLGWPLPNIDQMLHRIGSRSPKYFAVMDLVSGYHQAALAAESKKFTAFTCFMGTYEWKRVPMGLTGAPSYFQQALATEVLHGIIHTHTELYIDDTMTHGRDFTEFHGNLRTVFERFRQHNVALNPSKVKVGLSEVEVLGHLINANGIDFTVAKKKSLVDLDKPLTRLGVKQFIGLANYFRNHVRDISKAIRPLEAIIPKYSRVNAKDPVVWTTDADDAYDFIVKGVRDLPMLHFINTNKTTRVVLETDACDYGIGAYLYQLVEGDPNPQPVAFISKALSVSEQRWATNVKECYAIFHAFKKLAYLIRDIHFTLKTDHFNLTYLNKGEGHILRWKLMIMEYNFDIDYIQGEDNIVADAFSRLCVRESTTTLNALQSTDLTADPFYVPEDLRKSLEMVHSSAVGHFGVDIPLGRVQAMGHSDKYLREYVKRFIQACPHCQKMSALRVPILTSPYCTSSLMPMQRLNIDTIGPLPMSSHGHQYIMVVIDTFTRYVELYPTYGVNGVEAVEAIIQHVGRWGCPSIISTDGGTQFQNNDVMDLLHTLEVKHDITVPYSKEENAVVERANKEVMRHLRAIIWDRRVKEQWAVCLPLVQRIINAKVHETTGVAPMSLINIDLNLDRNILHAAVHQKAENLGDYTAGLIQRQRMLIAVAQERLVELQRMHVHSESPAFDEIAAQFPVNSYVLVAYPMGGRPDHKLMAQWQGPMQVVSFEGATYEVRNLVTMKTQLVHVKRLKPFVVSSTSTPEMIAYAEAGVWEVRTVHDHRQPRRGSRQGVTLLVEWVGYPSRDDYSWEPWSAELVRTGPVVDYCQKISALRYLLPKGLQSR
jgi:hypothetical protein